MFLMQIKYRIRDPSPDFEFLTYTVLHSLQQVFGFILLPYQQTKHSMLFFFLRITTSKREDFLNAVWENTLLCLTTNFTKGRGQKTEGAAGRMSMDSVIWNID